MVFRIFSLFNKNNSNQVCTRNKFTNRRGWSKNNSKKIFSLTNDFKRVDAKVALSIRLASII